MLWAANVKGNSCRVVVGSFFHTKNQRRNQTAKSGNDGKMQQAK